MKRRHIENRFIEELERVHIISLACKNVGLSRQTVYRWMRYDPKFRQRVYDAIEMGIDSVCDLAESKMVGAIDRGDPWAVKFWLMNRHKDYKPKKPMSEQQANFVPVKTIILSQYDPSKAPDHPDNQTGSISY